MIDHREWTLENGRTMRYGPMVWELRSAFYTPLVARLKVPNTSYGEDYALGLRFSREYRIGRIYDVLYLCRRWDDNSDASLDIGPDEPEQCLQGPLADVGTAGPHRP